MSLQSTETVSALDEFHKKEQNRVDLRQEAISRFKAILDESKVAYLRTTDDVLFDEATDKWCTGGSFKVYLSNSSESANNIVPITFFVETQLKRFRGKAAEDGYFKVKLARLENHVSKQQGRTAMMAMYFGDEKKFYFKSVKNLLSYLEATRRDEKGRKASYLFNKEHAVRFDPKPENEEKYDSMALEIGGKEQCFRTTFSENMGHIQIDHENPLYMTEPEIVHTLKTHQQYEEMWKLKQKTISRIINRGE